MALGLSCGLCRGQRVQEQALTEDCWDGAEPSRLRGNSPRRQGRGGENSTCTCGEVGACVAWKTHPQK